MYRFSYVENVAAQPQVADRQQFLQLLRSEKVKQTCEQILQAPDADAKAKLKRSLPAICWHAYGNTFLFGYVCGLAILSFQILLCCQRE